MTDPTTSSPRHDLVDEVEQQPPTQAERKAQRQAVRAAFAERRAHGIRRRHHAKLAHFAKHGYPAELADLQAKIAARAEGRRPIEPEPIESTEDR